MSAYDAHSDGIKDQQGLCGEAQQPSMQKASRSIP